MSLPKINHPSKKQLRQALRQAAMAPEAVLWNLLKHRKLGKKFRRQVSIGPYIVDFYCPDRGLVIELDGAGHFGPNIDEYEANRTEYIEQQGIRVIRFENRVLFENPEAVLSTIKEHL